MKKLILFIVFLYSSIFAQEFLHANGQKIVDQSGNEIIFKGIGLGGWLVPEGYMLNMSSFANSPTEIENKVIDLVGQTDADSFFENYRKNFVTKADIDSISAWGFNSIRLPMHYKFMTPKDQPFVYIEKGFAYIDSLISWCRPHNIYVILDLHAAPGGQNSGAISDYDPAYPSLWEDNTNKLRTIDLWKHIAERYKNEPLIAGYELLNETNWNLPPNNQPLRDLFVNITNAIREVDSTHIIFIEGNTYATDLSGLTPPWDFNMAYSFHKYWSTVSQSSIQSYLSIRNNYNVPMWMSESGENSNAWFTEFISLLNQNDVGWHWWTYKKFRTIKVLASVPISPQFQILLDYWNGNASKPSHDFAVTALQLQAENLKIKNCTIKRGVLDAMMRQPYDDTVIPFRENTIPGTIYAADYDYGKNNVAYHDVHYEINSSGEDYNSGWTYRNDGVDIEKCTDQITNGYNVGWIETGDWTQYTINVTQGGTYDLLVRIASQESGGKIQFYLDNATLTDLIDVPVTGGWQNWQTLRIQNVEIPAGPHKFVARFYFGGFNINYINFDPLTVGVNDEDNLPKKYMLYQNYPNPFNPSTKIKYSIPNVRQGHASALQNVVLKVYDILGREITTLVNKEQIPGNYTIEFDASHLTSGVYFYDLQANRYNQTRKFVLLK